MCVIKKPSNLKQFLDVFIPFCQRNLYESCETPSNEEKTSLKLNGSLSYLAKQNIKHQWWLHTVTSFEEPVFAVHPSSSSIDRQHLSRNSLFSYPDMLQLVKERLPFGLAQIGYCQHEHQLLPSRSSMTCLMSQFFTSPASSPQWFEHILRHRMSWWKKFSGTPTYFTKVPGQSEEDGSTRVEIWYKFPWGKSEPVEWVSNRGTQPLLTLSQKNQMNVEVKDGRKVYVPHVIETHAFTELALFTYLAEALIEKRSKDQTKMTLQLHRFLTPYKVSVVQSGTNSKLKELVEYLTKELKRSGVPTLQSSNLSTTLTQHFTRCDEMGVPYCVVVNESTLENGIVYLRNRDTALQEQLHVTAVAKFVKKYVTTNADMDHISSLRE